MSNMVASALNLTPAERQSFAQLYSMADSTNAGVVTGDAAVKFFEGFKLPTLTLGQIWSIADSGNNGFLTFNSFAVAMRLTARAQRGESVNEHAVHIPGEPPVHENVLMPSNAIDSSPVSLISPEDKARFMRIFAMVGPTNGVLNGDQVKDVFLKSKLPYSKLGEIWNLADTKQRGVLDLTDFIIGMHYIQGTMNGTITTLPTVLPNGMYESASDHSSVPSTPLQPQRTGTDQHIMPSPVPASALAPPSASMPAAAPARASTLFSGPAPERSTTMPATALSSSGPLSDGWAITPADKTRYDGFFDSLDTERAGYVDGSVVVPFFLQSGLDESTLAHVWDLTDMNQSGTLTRDEFAVAMHLINDRISGKELPQELPASLVPPSMRSQTGTKQTETQRDLFSLLDTDVPSSRLDVGSPFDDAAVAAAPAPSNTKTPELPKTISVNPDAAAAGAGLATVASANAGTSAVTDGLGGKPREVPQAFDDDFDAPLSALSRDTKAEETSKALESSNKDLEDVKARRAAAESTLSSHSTTIGELEAQLARARNAFASEQMALKEVEDKVQVQNAEITSLRQDVIREESELSAIRTQRDELEQKLLQDRESAHELRRQLAELETETSRLRESHGVLEQQQRKEADAAAALNKQLSSARDEHESLSRSMSPNAGAPPTTRARNPFEALYNEGDHAYTEEPVRFDSQYGFDAFTAAGAGVAAGATLGGTASQGKEAVPATEENEHEKGPEAPDAMRHDTAPDTNIPREDVDDMDVPGGFPSQAHTEPSAHATSAVSSAPGKPVQVIDLPAPEPHSPNTSGTAAMPSNDVMKSSIPPSSASTVTLPASSEPQTPSLQTSQQKDDFELAFSHMSFANVVQHQTKPAASGVAPASLGKNLGVSSRSPVTGGVPAYLQQSTKLTAAAARQPMSGGVPVLAPTAGATPQSTAAPVSTPQDAFEDNFSPNKPLSPPQPTQARAPTPPVPGDIGPVRQLCQMGFSRSQVVKALERSNYRTERALERLLSQQQAP
mgnify:FL=1